MGITWNTMWKRSFQRHGKEYANEIFCLLNLFAFLIHGLQRLMDDDYRKAYDHASRKIDFF